MWFGWRRLAAAKKKKKKAATSHNKQHRSLFHRDSIFRAASAAMGVYLSQPCKVVDAEEGAGNGLRYAAGEMQVNAT